jgi:transcription elongation factor GreA
MTQKDVFLTKEGLAQLEAELDHLRNVKRQEVAQRIHEAKELANPDHNAEYDDAKNERAFVEGRILTLENMIKNATIIDEGNHTGPVSLGARVVVVNAEGEQEQYIIVGSAEANPREGKISNESPVGRALLGKKIGDEVQVMAPAGVLKLTVKEIT